MKERSEIIEWIRGELIGPSRPITEPDIANFKEKVFVDPLPFRRGPLAWQPIPGEDLQEVLYFGRESPHRKYGAGILHPQSSLATREDQVALHSTDTIGAENEQDETHDIDESATPDRDGDEDRRADVGFDDSDDFEVTSPDLRHPSSIGISFCTRLQKNSQILILLPQSRRFTWQPDDAKPIMLNGRYEICAYHWTDIKGRDRDGHVWRRYPALLPDTCIVIKRSELMPNRLIRKEVVMPESSPISLCIEVFPRLKNIDDDEWLITAVVRNAKNLRSSQDQRESILYQTFFEVKVLDGALEKYPESDRPFEELDPEEQSLALLYRESATWGIGHGCAAGWDSEPGERPLTVYADVLPAVELPSMTPVIEIEGQELQISMRAMSSLPDSGIGPEWDAIEKLSNGYSNWIDRVRNESFQLPKMFRDVSIRHIDSCEICLNRIKRGIELLKSDLNVRNAFRLANLSMLLQQIATKQLVSVHPAT